MSMGGSVMPQGSTFIGNTGGNGEVRKGMGLVITHMGK